MLQKLQNWIYPYIQKRKFDDDEEMQLFLVMQVALLFAFFVHAFLLVMSIIGGDTILCYTNIASFIAYCYCFYLVHKGRYTGAGIFFTLEVAGYSLLTVIVRGTGNYNILYLVLVITLQVIVAYANWRVRVSMGGLLLIFGIIFVFLEMHGASQVQLQTIDYVYAVFNVVVLFLGLVIELLVGTVVRRIVAGFNEQRVLEYRTQAYTDQLTGLYNRRYADILFEQIKRGKQRQDYFVAMADIDDFKKINDTYGHPTGDDVLVHLARFLNDRFRKSDVIFRWGGEEFVLFLAGIDETQAERLLNSAREDIAKQKIATRTKPLQITITMGAKRLDPHNIEATIAACDAKMYEGKRSGKNKVVL